MSFEVTILGCGSATPTSQHNPSAQLLHMAERFFLIDCGEGTQLQLRRYGISMGKINHIFISHLHGDHYFGLVGIISSYHLQNRKNELHIYGPKMLQQIIEIQLEASNTKLQFALHFHAVDASAPNIILEDRRVEVTALPLRHNIACTGFLFRERPKDRHINPEAMTEYEVPVYEIYKLKKGEDFCREDGTVVKNELLTLPPTPQLSYAYCSDTAYAERLADWVQGVNALYHESTFLQADKKRAEKTRHSTTQQAAKIALLADVKQLLIGHYSARYGNDQLFEDEAKTIFENTIACAEGMRIITTHNGTTISR